MHARSLCMHAAPSLEARRQRPESKPRYETTSSRGDEARRVVPARRRQSIAYMHMHVHVHVHVIHVHVQHCKYT